MNENMKAYHTSLLPFFFLFSFPTPSWSERVWGVLCIVLVPVFIDVGYICGIMMLASDSFVGLFMSVLFSPHYPCCLSRSPRV